MCVCVCIYVCEGLCICVCMCFSSSALINSDKSNLSKKLWRHP